ncbi:DNA repair protein RecO [Methyloferula stellata]|uniref:DNA repair protein RecO n=1 Tax=Methyloferula stellata TaxID=876270 RepID=UPI000380F390|nr:DNA repair protein RecO [Methyloferula stellata]
MEWRDEGLITGLKKYGETSVILEVMTKAHGRHLGLVKGGRSKRMHAVLQPGNQADLVWRARLDEHLGTFAVEATALRASRFLANSEALHALNLITSLLRLMPERDPHQNLYRAASLIADELDTSEHIPAMLVRFEMVILAELGFGLDLDSCAATGGHEDLIYVSPKSGRAVSREAGAPYRDKLLPLPAFLRGEDHDTKPPPCDIRDGFRLTEYFLMRDLFAPRGLAMPAAHHAYLAEISKSA